MKNKTPQDKLERITGISTKRLSAGVRRVLGLDRLEFALCNGLDDIRTQVRKKIDRLMGKSLTSKRMRLCRVFAIDQLETRMMLSATWGNTDGVMTWTDDSGTTQALDVTSGNVEVHFTDDVNNTGDITEIRFLGNGGLDITTSNIDWINGNGFDLQTLNFGVTVGSVAADTSGTIDLFQAKEIKGATVVNGNIGTMTLTSELENTLTVSGNVGTINIDEIESGSNITIGGDLDNLIADSVDNAQIVANNVVGAFQISIGSGGGTFSYSNTFASATQVTFNGLSNTVTTGGSNNAPTVSNATFSLAENAANSASVGTVSASDPDSGDTLTYAITAGNGAGLFAINSSTGEITVADNSTLDFETTASYGLTVQVTDGGSLTDTATVTVNVTNINETPSVSNAIFSLAENAANAASVGSIASSDPDSGDTLTYAITAGNGAGLFAINSSTGVITVADNSNLNFETTPSYSLTVQVTDGGSLTDTATVTVNVTDVSNSNNGNGNGNGNNSGNGNGNNSHTHIHTTANGQTHSHNHVSAHAHTHGSGGLNLLLTALNIVESTTDSNAISALGSESVANATFATGSASEQLRTGASVLEALKKENSSGSAATNATEAAFSQRSTERTNFDIVNSDTSEVDSSKDDVGKKEADAPGQTSDSKLAATGQTTNDPSGTPSVASTHEQSGTQVASHRIDSSSAASLIAPLTTVIDASLSNALMDGTDALFSQLDNMARDMKSPVNVLLETPLGQVVVTTTATAAAGFALYDVRKLPMLVGAFSAVAHWRQFDLLGILDDSNDKLAGAGANNARTLVDLVG